MEIYLPEQYADTVISISKSFEIDAQIVGRVETSAEKRVTLRTPNGEFIYS